MTRKWIGQHEDVIRRFLTFLNKEKDTYVLKGGTALMCCYGLDRFSEDIDLDGTNQEAIFAIVEKFCKQNNYDFRVAKNTNTVKRFMINYGNNSKPLKVEVSYRKKIIDEQKYEIRNGICVYNINSIADMKILAYTARDRIRDMYDLAFIADKYWDELSPTIKETMQNAIEYKGVEQFDYMIATQKDELINEDKLEIRFLEMYDKLNLVNKAAPKVVEKTLPEFVQKQRKSKYKNEIEASYDEDEEDFER